VIPTPFRDEKIDVPALQKITDRMVHAGVHGLWVLGVGGEQDALTDAEQDTVLRTVLGAHPAIPVSAGVTSPHPTEAIHRAQRASALGCANVFALQPLDPHDDPPKVVEYYRHLARTGIETVAYVDTGHWERHGVDGGAIIAGLDPLWDLPISGVKLACQDFRLWVALNANAVRRGLLVFTASGRLALAALASGAHGVVADDATVAPEWFVGLFDAWCAGDHTTARDIQSRMMEIGRLISATSIGGAKYALAEQGLCGADTRRAQSPNEPLRQKISAELHELGSWQAGTRRRSA
jgi:dihydrodipicolinate synthase/N-acetylneuraminate lyase